MSGSSDDSVFQKNKKPKTNNQAEQSRNVGLPRGTQSNAKKLEKAQYIVISTIRGFTW